MLFSTRCAAWSGLDTLHIISGLPSTQRLMALAAGPATASGEARSSPDDVSPSLAGLERIRDEARRVSDVNEMGVALAVAAFVSGGVVPTEAYGWVASCLF